MNEEDLYESRRYRFFKWIDKLLQREIKRCVDCGEELTDLEAYYFDCRCGKCEGMI